MKQFFILLSFLFCFFSGMAQDFPEPMQPRRMVNDFAGVFSQQEQNALEARLRAFNDTSSTQIAIATLNTLNGYDPNDYAQRLAEKWGIGQKGKDNGILILVKPKTASENGQIAISVGYGLEGVIPDAIASSIIRNEVIPSFQQNQYYAGVNNAVNTIIKFSSGEYTADQYEGGSRFGYYFLLILFIFIFFIFPLLFRRRGITAGNRGLSRGAPFIFLGGGGRSSGGFGSFSSGSGGFGGFGGGSFGGGGASGSW